MLNEKCLIYIFNDVVKALSRVSKVKYLNERNFPSAGFNKAKTAGTSLSRTCWGSGLCLHQAVK